MFTAVISILLLISAGAEAKTECCDRQEREVEIATTELRAANDQVTSAQTAVRLAKEKLETARTAANARWDALTEEERRAKDKDQFFKTELQGYEDNLATANRLLESAQSAVSTKQAEVNQAKTQLNVDKQKAAQEEREKVEAAKKKTDGRDPAEQSTDEELGLNPGEEIGRPGDPNGDPEKDKQALDRALERNPNNPKALARRAIANQERGDIAAACADAQAAQDLDPNEKTTFAMLKTTCKDPRNLPTLRTKSKNLGRDPEEVAKELEAQKKRNEAGRQPDQQVQGPAEGAGPGGREAGGSGLAPGGPSASLASAYGAQGSAAGGQRSLGFGTMVSPQRRADSMVRYEQGTDFFKRGHLKEALDYINAALELDPNNAKALFMRSSILRAMKRYKEAAADAAAGLALAPGNRPLLNAKSMAQNKAKEYKDALAAAEEVLAQDPTNAMALANKAYALWGLGDRAAMLELLKTAASLDPNYEEILRYASSAPSDSDPPFFFPGEKDESAMLARQEKQNAPAAAPKKGINKKLLAGIGAGLLLLMALLLKPGAAPAPEAAPAEPTVSEDGRPLIKGQYEVLGSLGEGGMGLVSEAFDRKLERRVAVKKMRDELKSSPTEWRRFAQEAKLIAQLSHPYIVSIHDVVEQDADLYLIFDYVDGRPLSGVIEAKRQMALPEVKKVFEQVCQAVEFAHSKNILHRDLKPSNIMIDKNGYAKVMDFGLARQVKDTLSRLTQSGATSGTLAFMAPEQHMGEAGKPADVYSLGVCVYECLTGKLPFYGPDFLQQKERCAYKPVSELAPHLPKEIDAVIAAALKPNPAERISEVKDFLARLQSLPV